MNENVRRLPERKVEDAETFVAKILAEAAAEREQRLRATAKLTENAPPIELLKQLANPEKPKRNLLAIPEGAASATKGKKPKREIPTAGNADEEEALKAEAPIAVTDLGPEEEKRRRIIRWTKLEELNRKCAVIRSFGGKCVVVTEGQSRHDPNKKVFDFQFREAFEAWLANDFVLSLEKKNKNDAVGPWWWRHPKRRQYDGVIFKPLAPPIVRTSDGQLLNTYLGWGVEPKQGDWSLIRKHIKEVWLTTTIRPMTISFGGSPGAFNIPIARPMQHWS